MNKAWIGIDSGKFSFAAAVAGPSTKPQDWASLPVREFTQSAEGLTEFVAWVAELSYRKCRVAGVCIEATGRYSQAWVDLLRGRLGAVSVVNPARPKAYRQSLGVPHKNDGTDARILAVFGKALEPAPEVPPSKAQRRLRELSRHRHDLQGQLLANQQRLEGSPEAMVRKSLQRTIKMLQREIARAEEAMQATVREDERLLKDYKHAVSVKGIGPQTALVILAEFGDLRTYKRNEVVALAGLYPREHSSGTSIHKPARLAKGGKAPVRASLYMCAMSAMRANPDIKVFAERLKDHGKAPMQVIAAVMRKLLLIVRAVVVTETDYIPNYRHGGQSQSA